MIDLERSLTELAQRLEIPDDPWLVDEVVSRVGSSAPRPRRVASPAWRLGAAAAAIVIVALVAVPGPRHAVARWLGFDSVRIEPGTTVATSATLPAEPALDLGRSVSISAAMQTTGLPDPTPSLLGKPLSVHVVQPPRAGQIVLVYAPSDLVPQSSVIGVGALVSVMPAHLDDGFFQKTLGITATVRPVDVDGATGYWIEGAPHELLFDFGDVVQQDTLRLATNTLLWQRGDDVFRIEADVDLATALRIATSIP